MDFVFVIFFCSLFFSSASRTVAANVVAGAGYFGPPIYAVVLRGELLGVLRYVAKRREKKKETNRGAQILAAFFSEKFAVSSVSTLNV